MGNGETREMMRRCADELKYLRRRIDELAPKAEAYDMLRQVLGLLPHPPTAVRADLIWLLEKRLGELEKEEAEAKAELAKPAVDPVALAYSADIGRRSNEGERE